jgi:tubulin polyglutamylase TTLL5
LLIDRLKFDLRIYVLVTSFNPLEVFIFKEGFARFSTEEFSLHPDDIKRTQIHLTNFSIQKHFFDPVT